MVQWRIKGNAFIIGNDIEGEGEQSKESSGVRTVKSEIGSRMRLVKEEGKEDWSWKTELTAHFGNMAPGMRGMLDFLTAHRMILTACLRRLCRATAGSARRSAYSR